jgi:hypothetical protein
VFLAGGAMNSGPTGSQIACLSTYRAIPARREKRRLVPQPVLEPSSGAAAMR